MPYSGSGRSNGNGGRGGPRPLSSPLQDYTSDQYRPYRPSQAPLLSSESPASAFGLDTSKSQSQPYVAYGDRIGGGGGGRQYNSPGRYSDNRSYKSGRRFQKSYGDLAYSREQSASVFEVHAASFVVLGVGFLLFSTFILIPRLEMGGNELEDPSGALLKHDLEKSDIDSGNSALPINDKSNLLDNPAGAPPPADVLRQIMNSKEKNGASDVSANQRSDVDPSKKLWRDDGRCGPNFPAPGAPDFGQCDPLADADQKGPCCNPSSGYCGNIRGPKWGHCPPACRDCVDYTPGGYTGTVTMKSKGGAAAPPGPAFKFPESVRNATPPEGSRIHQDIGTASLKEKPKTDAEKVAAQRRETVKKMMKSAWKGYTDYGFGENELMPKAQKGHSAGIFGNTKMGATIVDALDTLIIMGLDDEVKIARKWINESLRFDVEASVSVFEVTIRFVGGLLSAYAMTGDDVYKNKAYDIAQHLLPAFNTPTGIPMAQINLQTKATKNWGWASGKCSILSEFGTMQLEFEYLSLITGDMRFADMIQHVTKLVLSKKPDNGLYPNYLNPKTGNWGSKHVSLGALGDSFYEYLLKLWIYHGGRNNPGVEVDELGRAAFDDSMDAVQKNLVHTSAQSKLLYLSDMKNTKAIHKMGHLACFMGGLYALAMKGASPELSEVYKKNAEGITNTCHEGYDRSKAKLGPESMMFSGSTEATSSRSKERYYILRPETVEAYFYMWRLTKDPKYREWAWEATEAIEKECRCGENGYCGIKDVAADPLVQDDVQQSFFLAETLKYLYLIQCDDDVISLDLWVLNTEAHPLPIQNYRRAKQTMTKGSNL